MAEEDEETADNGHHEGERRGPAATAADASAQLLEANRRLRESAERRDDLLSLAAADLRGPAAALLRHVRRMRRGEAALSQADRRSLESMERQARRVAALSDGLVALKTFEGGKVQLHREPVELGALLAGVADGRTPAAAARSIQLDRAFPAGPVTLPADASRLEQVVGTLLDSAIAATARGGRVRLALEASADVARITVEDGRAAAQAARRAALRGTTGRLSGLGLAVCRSVAEQHGGALEIALRGGRLVAELTLPASPRPAAREPLPAGAGWQRARVLVVDDDVDAREALSMMLGDDYDVVLAGDGREALDAAVVCRPDVVLMDFYMPRMDGLAALEALRLEPATADVPVILISGRGDEIVRSRSLDQGAVDFLQKPFSGRELKSRMERTLRLTRRETQLQALARTDPLTGLANVRAFRVRLDEEVKRAQRYRTPLACVMVDMDHLKPINDALGHGAGDAAIAAVAEVLRRELRETDFGARYGGDEFVMLLPHTSSLEARAFAERVCVRLGESPLEVRGHVLPLHASFGIAALGDEPLPEAGELLVQRADAALYAAKRGGRGRVAAHPSSEPDQDEPVAPAPS